MDVFKLLKMDHKEAKGLFKKIESSSASKSREKLFQQLADALNLHTEMEEQIFYPRLREEEKLRETIGEAYEEHHVAKLLLDELLQTSIDDERWESKFTVLMEMIQHHVQEEEKELFPKAAKALGKEESKQLGQQIEAAKAERMKGMRKAKRASKETSSGDRAAMRA
jgi:hemerythrin superfamily protein